MKQNSKENKKIIQEKKCVESLPTSQTPGEFVVRYAMSENWTWNEQESATGDKREAQLVEKQKDETSGHDGRRKARRAKGRVILS